MRFEVGKKYYSTRGLYYSEERHSYISQTYVRTFGPTFIYVKDVTYLRKSRGYREYEEFEEHEFRMCSLPYVHKIISEDDLQYIKEVEVKI